VQKQILTQDNPTLLIEIITAPNLFWRPDFLTSRYNIWGAGKVDITIRVLPGQQKKEEHFPVRTRNLFW
jgi:hypothetical protein